MYRPPSLFQARRGAEGHEQPPGPSFVGQARPVRATARAIVVPQLAWQPYAGRPYVAPQACLSRHRVWRREGVTAPTSSFVQVSAALQPTASLRSEGVLQQLQELATLRNSHAAALTPPLAPGAGGGELVISEERLSLLCPVTLAPLSKPARGWLCLHRSCCEAASLRWLLSVKERATCPICDADLKAGPIQEDAGLAKLMADAVSLGISRTHQLAFGPDGARFVEIVHGMRAPSAKVARQQHEDNTTAGGCPSSGRCAVVADLNETAVIDLSADDEVEEAGVAEPLAHGHSHTVAHGAQSPGEPAPSPAPSSAPVGLSLRDPRDGPWQWSSTQLAGRQQGKKLRHRQWSRGRGRIRLR